MIRSLTMAILPACLLTSVAFCQEDGAEPATYEVVLTEFHLTSGHDPELSSEMIIRNFLSREKKDNLELVETIRLTVYEDLECTAQFGKQLQVTKGVINNPRGVQRMTQTMQVGTMARVRVSPENGKLALQIQYAASRLEDQEKDGPPDVISSTYKATLAVEPNKPALVGGIDTDVASYLIVYVR